MSPVEIGLIGLGLLFLLIALNIPIAFSMALIGFAGFAYMVSFDSSLLKLGTVPFTTISSYDLAVMPLFMFMAHLCFRVGFAEGMFEASYKWLGRLPGGLAIATVGACALFAAISASSLATAVTIGLVAFPQMMKYRYDPRLAAGCIAAGGTIGVMIPPSGGFILYGIITQTSIGKLFIAGIIPGICQALLYITVILLLCRINPGLGPRAPVASFKEKFASLAKLGDMIILIIIVLGGLFAGLFTPTEAGAVGAVGAVILAIARRKLTWKMFKSASIETGLSTGMVYALFIGAFLLNYFMAVSTIPSELANLVNSLALPPLGVMAIIIVIYIILGCFIDAIAMLLLTLPIFFPMVMGLGFDPIWFGVVIVLMTEIASITPPMGLVVFAIAGIFKDVKLEQIFKGVTPFFFADLVLTLLLVLVPGIALLLPGLMK